MEGFDKIRRIEGSLHSSLSMASSTCRRGEDVDDDGDTSRSSSGAEEYLGVREDVDS